MGLLRIDYCDEYVIQESSYISGTTRLNHTYYAPYEPQYVSLLDHRSKNEIRHTFQKGKLKTDFFSFIFSSKISRLKQWYHESETNVRYAAVSLTTVREGDVLPFQNVSARPHWVRHKYGGSAGPLQRIHFWPRCCDNPPLRSFFRFVIPSL